MLAQNGKCLITSTAGTRFLYHKRGCTGRCKLVAVHQKVVAFTNDLCYACSARGLISLKEKRMATIPGIDVSYWNAGIDAPKVGATGQRFVFAKATEGEFYCHPPFYHNVLGEKPTRPSR